MEGLALSNLSVTRGSFRLQSVTLTVSEHEYLVVIGKTGSGKTTLLKTIAGAYSRVTGNITLDGNDVTPYPPERRRIVYVPQNYSLFNHMNVYGNIKFGLSARGVSNQDVGGLISDISKELGITDLLGRSPVTLSGGEQQKVSLARALVTKPRTLLLDEPLSMVDPETKNRLLIVLNDIPKKHDCSVIHVTHDWDEAYALANRMAVINEGRIVEVGEPRRIFERPKSHHTAQLTGFQNIMMGIASPTESGSIVEIGPAIKIRSKSVARGRVYFCVRPEWISVQFPEEGENILQGSVTGMLRERLGVRLVLAVKGVEFIILAKGKFEIGEKITFQIPPSSAHLISVDGDST